MREKLQVGSRIRRYLETFAGIYGWEQALGQYRNRSPSWFLGREYEGRPTGWLLLFHGGSVDTQWDGVWIYRKELSPGEHSTFLVLFLFNGLYITHKTISVCSRPHNFSL